MKGNFFIRNPYAAMVVAIVITLCGVIALFRMGVAQYPDITPPQIAVNLNYPGADAATLLNSVVIPLEQQINGAPGMIYLDSTSADSGNGVITATFDIGSDPERNRQNVQERVDRALPLLPEAVQREGVIVREQAGNILLGISLLSPNGIYNTLFMNNYAVIHLQNKLARIPGVSRVQIFGGADYAMRIWIDSDKCASLGLSVDSVVEALKSQNMQVSSGTVGAAPAPAGTRFQRDVRVKGRLMSVEEFSDIIVRVDPAGGIVRMREVAQVSAGAESYSTDSTLNRRSSVIIMIFPLNGANGIRISADCRKVMEECARDFPPGLIHEFQYDSTDFVRAGIKDVVKTLLFAIALVALVTWIFLQDWRMALIPTLAIPVSIVGSFAILAMIGFSVNMVTLFGVTLAIGIVVDDAIIVIENVSRLMDTEQLSPRDAAEKSMKQISGAIVATTAVLLAMFLPICFFPGISGELYRQFGITLVSAVLLSAFNALSLSPALCSILLLPHEKAHDKGFFGWFNRAFGKLGQGAGAGLKRLIAAAIPAAAATLIAAGGILWYYSGRPSGFLPEEDQGYFFAIVKMQPGSSLERTAKAASRLSGMTGALPGVAAVIAIPGYNALNSTPASDYAFVIAVLEPWGKRNRSAAEILQMARHRAWTDLPEGFTMMFQPPAIPGIGLAGGFNFVLEETGDASGAAQLATVLNRLLAAASSDPNLSNVFSDFSSDTPSLFLKIDRTKALRMGVPLSAVDRVLENTLGYSFINQYNRFGQVYKVEVQGRIRDRESGKDILRLHVQNADGSMTPMDSIATVGERFTASFLTRHNLKSAANLQGSPAPGKSSSEAMAAIESLARRILPPGFGFEWTDISYQEAAAGNATPLIFGLAVTFIFLFLSALYGSWLLPWSVICVIPAALGAALLLLDGTGIADNIYTRIGIVLLFGMACKTAILVADFAKQRHDEGHDASESAVHAATVRFRAVMMTSLAFIFGTMPLAFASGPGSAGERSIGVPVVGGMPGAVIGGIFLCPLFFALFMGVLDRKAKNKSRLPVWIGSVAALLFFNGCYTPPAGGDLIEEREFPGSSGSRSAPLPERELRALTRGRAVEIALERNPDYRSAGLAIHGAKMRYYQALGAYSPTLSAGFSIGQQQYNPSGHHSSFNSSYNSGYTYTSVQANWMLFDGLSREFEMLSARHGIKVREHLEQNAKRLLIQAVQLAFDEIGSARAQQKIARSNLEFQSEELRQAETKYRIGEISVSDVLSFKGQCEQAQSSLLRAENQEALARFALASLLAIPAGTFPDGTVFSETTPDECAAGAENLPSEEFFLNSAVANRPDLNAIREQLQIGRYEYYQGYSLFSPTVSAFTGYTYSSSNFQGGGSGGSGSGSGIGNFFLDGGTFQYGGWAGWNIFNGFRRYNQLRERRISLDQAHLRGSDEWIKTVKEVRSAYADSQFARKILRNSAALRETRLQERNVVRGEYHAGEAPVIRLDQAQNRFVQSEYELVEAKLSLRKALIRLQSAAAVTRPEAR